jgi:hypothetical protein
MILFIGKSFEHDEFYQEIFLKISSVLVVPNPPEILLATFSSFDILIDRIKPESHYDYLFLIISSAHIPIFKNSQRSFREASIDCNFNVTKCNSNCINSEDFQLF